MLGGSVPCQRGYSVIFNLISSVLNKTKGTINDTNTTRIFLSLTVMFSLK